MTKLFYYHRRDRLNNFGDALNPWLWHQLLPDFFDQDETTIFVGIGTLLNSLLPHRLPKAERVIIFSSGVGYEKPLSVIPASWKIYSVRGPLSAQSLGLPANLAVADGAILIKRLFKSTGNKTHRFGFIPHIHHATYADTIWQSICSDIGFKYIDPRDSVAQILSDIDQTQVLLAEAMHGAIAADALRVPWIPVHTSARILAFKWQDWCASMNVDYHPWYISPLIHAYPPVARGIRSSMRATRHWFNWLKQNPWNGLNYIGGDQESVTMQLIRIAQTAQPRLSDEQQLEQRITELEEKLHQLSNECGKPLG
ncbi:ExoV-like protein [Coleofasciculus chthonoplastes PCC 7420]|uniref:ExoV-like protein n=1 Tax=Coleofasciculus chthonoplastes PCC 7420 TaxID=118168 RepID=B4VJ51_9CYAN|nr:polysaccharide pyruvyl transferase family protein [Coleofasciculus chthonoplastes]EDX78071.1 ExoV-like protein [Coleofasciculus chthonoplastes PCC 7420]